MKRGTWKRAAAFMLAVLLVFAGLPWNMGAVYAQQEPLRENPANSFGTEDTQEKEVKENPTNLSDPEDAQEKEVKENPTNLSDPEDAQENPVKKNPATPAGPEDTQENPVKETPAEPTAPEDTGKENPADLSGVGDVQGTNVDGQKTSSFRLKFFFQREDRELAFDIPLISGAKTYEIYRKVDGVDEDFRCLETISSDSFSEEGYMYYDLFSEEERETIGGKIISYYVKAINASGTEIAVSELLSNKGEYYGVQITDGNGQPIDAVTVHVGESVNLSFQCLVIGAEPVKAEEAMTEISVLNYYLYYKAPGLEYEESDWEGKYLQIRTPDFEKPWAVKLKGIQLPQERSYSVSVSLDIYSARIPVTVLEAEPDVDYGEDEEIKNLFTDREAFNQAIRDELAKRTPEVTYYIPIDIFEQWDKKDCPYEEDTVEYWNYHDWSIDEVFDFYEEREGIKPYEGDYMSNCLKPGLITLYNMEDWYVNNVRYKRIKVTVPFITTRAQEDKVDEKIEALMHKPGGALYSYRNASDYEKIKACYNYVKNNVSYIGTVTAIYHTAYSALINGKATCEGYALLLYRLLYEFGIVNKVLMGTDSAAHTYNIVKLDGMYYYVDASNGRFLKGEKDFSKTTYQEKYQDEKFKKNFLDKISKNSYVPSFTVTLNANGGRLVNGSEAVSQSAIKVSGNAAYGPLPVPVRENYSFLGWYTAQAGGTKVTEATKIIKAADHTLYAHWDGVKAAEIDILADGSSVKNANLYIDLGEENRTLKLTAAVKPDEAKDTPIIWKSGNAKAASVDTEGTVTGISNGTAVIKATAADGSGKTASVTVVVRTAVKQITIEGASQVAAGKSVQLTARILPSEATTKKVKWSSSDSSKLTVTAGGKAAAKAGAAGKVTVTAEAADGSGVYGSRELTITAAATNVWIYRIEDTDTCINGSRLGMDADVKEKNTLLLKAKVTAGESRQNVSQEVIFSSSNPGVVSIEATGEGECTITAGKRGNTVITAMAADGSRKKAAFTVSVSTQVSKIKIDGMSEVGEGKSIALKGIVLPDSANVKKLTWQSSDPEIAEAASNGKVKGKKKGTVTITAAATDGSGIYGSKVITVTQPADSVSIYRTEDRENCINKTKVGLDIDKEGKDSVELQALIMSDGTVQGVSQEVTWKSSQTAVAVVTVSGAACTVTAQKPGTATITAAAADGSGKKATFTVYVSAQAERLIVNGASAVGIGKRISLSGMVLPDSATMKKITWKSSDTDIATVSSSGVVKGKTKGSAVITATAADGSGVFANHTVAVQEPAGSVIVKQGTEAVIGTVNLDVSKASEKTVMLKAEVKNASGNTENVSQSVTWKSSKPSIAYAVPNQDGSCTITALAEGKAKITAVAADGSGKKKEITVHIVQSGVEIKGSRAVAAGKSIQLKSSGPAADWSIAGVSGSAFSSASIKKGKLTANSDAAAGTQITVRAVSKSRPEIWAEHTVTVCSRTEQIKIYSENKDVTKTVVGFERDNIGSETEGTLRLTAKGFDAKGAELDGVNQAVIWKSSNASIASVKQEEDGSCTVVPKKAGKATITAATEDGSKKSTSVTINTASLAGTITVTGPKQAAAGKSITLTAKVRPYRTGNKKAAWSVKVVSVPEGKELDKKAVSISNKGKLSVKSSVPAGTKLLVKAAAADGSLVCAADFEVTVVTAAAKVRIYSNTGGGEKEVTGQKLGIDRDTLGTIAVRAEILDAADEVIAVNGVTQGAIWKSSNPAVAEVSVNEDGSCQITAKKAGTAKITAAAADGSRKSASMTVSVASLVTAVAILGEDEIRAGSSIQLTALVLPYEAAQRKVSWEISAGLPAGTQDTLKKKDIVISSGGKLTVKESVPKGTVITVKASSTDGSFVNAVKTVTVGR